MEQLKLIPTDDLFDMLVEQTAKYLGMVNLRVVSKEEMEVCREYMTAIQLEIETRKSKNHEISFAKPAQDESFLETTKEA